ncbi:acyl-CoA dehydrogenase family protein [Algoriphagus sp.]|uniref:acyl-CoA dehydrogenase family protein n=1 Tax=Algoriphagus sp. TaxID=1872435 RepID=UPI0025FBBE0C|nr:acyl-CoA dehydrogenase family protein [Algoriphagus sp.]
MQSIEPFNHELATKAEKLGKLPKEWLEVIYQEKWFQLFVPKSLNGLGMDFLEALKVEEKLARLDGSLGWTVTLCAGAAWFTGFLNESLCNEVFPKKDLCFAGSGYVGGKAQKIGNEYLIQGSWTYASGALHATHFTANCELIENGNPLLDDQGNPIIKAFILKKEEVEILDGWNYMGMIATGSHAFKADKISVPLNRCFEIKPKMATLEDPIFQVPFLQFAEATLAVNILGIASHLIDLVEESFWMRHDYRSYDKKHLAYFESILSNKRKKLKKQKKKFYDQVEVFWESLEKDRKSSEQHLSDVSKYSRKLTGTCRKATSELFPFSGLHGAKTQTELNRVWRDFNTVSQHSLLIFPF